MFKKAYKILTLSAVLSAVSVFGAYAAPQSSTAKFPYDVEFNVDTVDRVCYAGHPGKTVQYKDGMAVTPETTFKITPSEITAGSEQNLSSEVSVTVSLIYENNDNTGSYKEVVKQYSNGDIKYGENLPILSENAASSLESRDKLYSDTLTGLEMTVSSKGRDPKKKTIYLYVCDDVDELTDTE